MLELPWDDELELDCWPEELLEEEDEDDEEELELGLLGGGLPALDEELVGTVLHAATIPSRANDSTVRLIFFSLFITETP